MKSTTVNINGKEVIVKKLALGKYADLLKSLKGSKVMEDLVGMGDITTAKVATMIPELVANSLPEVIKILSIASDVSTKELTEEYGLAEAVKLLVTILEVNDFQAIKKNLGGIFQKVKPAPVLVEKKTQAKNGSKE